MALDAAFRSEGVGVADVERDGDLHVLAGPPVRGGCKQGRTGSPGREEFSSPMEGSRPASMVARIMDPRSLPADDSEISVASRPIALVRRGLR